METRSNIKSSASKSFDKPLLKNPLIISKICSFLPLSALKTVRSLNSIWLRESRPHFLALAHCTLLPSAADDPAKWKARLGDYDARVGGWGHANFSINTNAYSVSTQNFNYEEQIVKFARRHCDQIKKLELTIKLKTKENFEFFLTFLKTLENGTLTHLSLCLDITRSNYAQGDLGALEVLPCLRSVRILRLSVPPGTHWPLPSININVGGRPGWEPREDFAGKILTMFPNIEDLKLGEDLQTLSLNLEYLAILAQIKGVKSSNLNSVVLTEPGIEPSSATPLLFPEKDGQSPPIPDFDYFANLRTLDLLISHSHMLVHLQTLDLPLEKITLKLGIQQNTPPIWESVTICLESLLDKHSPTLSHLSLEQRGQPLPDWNIWRISLPFNPKLTTIQVLSTIAVPIEPPQPVEETKGRIRLQDLFRIGPTSLELTFPLLSRVHFDTTDGSYSREVFDRLLPQEGVAQFPQILEINLTLPRNESQLGNVGEFSLCTQRLRNLFPKANYKNYVI